MIEYLWQYLSESWASFAIDFDPFRDSVDIILVLAGLFWVLVFVWCSGAVQIVIGLVVLIGGWLAS